MDTPRVCLITTDELARIGYLSHSQLESGHFSKHYLIQRTVIFGKKEIGSYVLWRFSLYGHPPSDDKFYTITSTKRLKWVVNWVWWSSMARKTNYETKRADRIIITKYTDNNFADQIDITFDDPIFTASRMKFSEELRDMLDRYHAGNDGIKK